MRSTVHLGLSFYKIGCAAFLIVCVVSSAGVCAYGDEPDAETRAGWRKISESGSGFVVWESSRTGSWRLWRRNLDGTDLRQLEPDEKGRDHFCPHISPDGKRLVYLSYPAGRSEYEDHPTTDISLHLIGTDGSGEKVLISAARGYGGDRAVVWFDNQRFAYLDGAGVTQEFDLGTGKSQKLTTQGLARGGFLVNATKTYATSGEPTFSPFDAQQGRVNLQGHQGGCEPYFTHDGRWGLWMGGAGGPINRFDLQTRQISPMLNKDDPRMPKGRQYLYFPMVSRNSRLFTFAASPNQHDHVKSDYEVFVARIDPKTLEVIDRPVRYSFDPATDRYPDVYVANPAGISDLAERPNTMSPQKPSISTGSWPVQRKGLVYLFETAATPNLVAGPDGKPRSFGLSPRGRARWNHNQAMVLTGGSFVAEGSEEQLLGACRQSQQLTVEAVIRPDHVHQTGPARIVTFSSSAFSRNFTLGQEADKLIFRLRTPATGENGVTPETQLATITNGEPLHVAVTYRPGQMTGYVNGKEVYRGDKVQGDLSNWELHRLVFGDEFNGQRNWEGTLEGVALYSRALEPTEVQQNATAYQRLLQSRKKVPQIDVVAKLIAKSPVPTLEEVKPYRGALMVCKYDVVQVVRGTLAEKQILVTHWALLDGQPQPIAMLQPGAELRLVLESSELNPQLQRFVCKDGFDSDAELLLPRYYDATP